MLRLYANGSNDKFARTTIGRGKNLKTANRENMTPEQCLVGSICPTPNRDDQAVLLQGKSGFNTLKR